jgi:glycerol-3-phosphate acyltransferase PlsY
MPNDAVIWPLMVGYAVGSIPFAWLIVRGATGLDLRRTGSGNVGAANALRSTRWRTGVVVALLDLAKGSAAVGAVALGGGDTAARALGAFAAIAGHVFPVWLRFHGGKGVATTCGAFALLTPAATAVAAAVFFLVATATRYVSLASLASVVVLATATSWAASPQPVAVAAWASASLVAWRHRSNVARLARGTERRLGRG